MYSDSIKSGLRGGENSVSIKQWPNWPEWDDILLALFFSKYIGMLKIILTNLVGKTIEGMHVLKIYNNKTESTLYSSSR